MVLWRSDRQDLRGYVPHDVSGLVLVDGESEFLQTVMTPTEFTIFLQMLRNDDEKRIAQWPDVERKNPVDIFEQVRAAPPVVTVQAGGTKRPLFYMHEDRIGGAYYCFLLADQLGPDQPFYTIEPSKFDDQQDLPTLEAMAAEHIKSLQAIQPEGPYLLGGFCIGGLLAYEMARQLQAHGQQVDLLVLIDPTSPAHFSDRLVRSTISGLGSLLRLPQKKQLYGFLWVRHLYRYLRFSDYRQAINTAERKRSRRNAALRSLGALFPPDQTLNQDLGAIPTWMLSAYTAGPYPGKITFFWAHEEVAGAAKWQNLAQAAKETELHIIPGDHLSCLTKHLPSLAEAFRVCLRQVQEAELERV